MSPLGKVCMNVLFTKSGAPQMYPTHSVLTVVQYDVACGAGNWVTLPPPQVEMVLPGTTGVGFYVATAVSGSGQPRTSSSGSGVAVGVGVGVGVPTGSQRLGMPVMRDSMSVGSSAHSV